ncbi:lysoplasmalogenase family protein [Citreicoccus inhibens]|uniref:lysoplasmalogenase family protein n=1 Tax=Citreicoccus inhibens TaxID=2849499 RepID=UPI002E2AC86A|nr:lysoplasmalogenase family protein [Citreicoccus inhibens]
MWPPRTRYARWIGAGLSLALLGDLLLEAGPEFFLPGLGAFLLAHLGYTAGYLHVSRTPRLMALYWAAQVSIAVSAREPPRPPAHPPRPTVA